MTYSSIATASATTTQRGIRDYPVDHVVLHHAATTSLDALVNLMQPNSGRTVSANYAIKDDQIVGTVPEEYRSWSLSSNEWDSRSVTAEICNETAGGSWPVSDASHESAARLTADVAKRYGFRPHRDGDPTTWTVIGHREVYSIHGASYATACPGGLDLDRVVRRAQQILNGPQGDTDMYVFRSSDSKSQGWDFAVSLGYIKNTQGNEGVYLKDRLAQPKFEELDAIGAEIVLRGFGLGEFVNGGKASAFLASLGGGKSATASWLKPAPVPLTDVEKTALAADIVALLKFPKVPTAEENGAAARAAIVK